jgi:hypothetical protein
MEITYETILKYLSPKETIKSKKNDFLEKGIISTANNFPVKFANLLSNKFYQYGVTVIDNEKINISFWASILTLLDNDFVVSYNVEENVSINNFKNKLMELYKKSKISSFMKELDKTDFRERFKLDPDVYVLQYIVDIMDINIIILDFKNETVHTVFKNDVMNPWKQTLLFTKNNSTWNPIMMSDQDTVKLFDYNNEYLRLLLECDPSYYEGEKINKNFLIYKNINDVIKLEKSNIVKSEPIVIEVKEEDYKSYNKTKLTKMKINEINSLVSNMKIDITNKKTTKPILIDLILEKVASL